MPKGSVEKKRILNMDKNRLTTVCTLLFQAMKLDLDYKDEKISSLTKELEDLNTGGATDEEVAAIKRQKHELELRLKDQVSAILYHGAFGSYEQLNLK